MKYIIILCLLSGCSQAQHEPCNICGHSACARPNEHELPEWMQELNTETIFPSREKWQTTRNEVNND